MANAAPPFDPSKNVLDLVEAAIKRLDDLAAMRDKVWEAELRAVHDKFAAVERLRLENKNDSKSAVDAALAAAKELVSSQATTAKEAMEQQANTSTAALNGLLNTINDLKERVGAVENVKLGIESHKTDARLTVGMVMGVVGGLVGLLLLIIAVATFVAANN